MAGDRPHSSSKSETSSRAIDVGSPSQKVGAVSNEKCLLEFELVGRYLRGHAINLQDPNRPLLVEIAFDGHVMATIRCVGLIRRQKVESHLHESDFNAARLPDVVAGGVEYYLSDYLPLSAPMALRIRALADDGEYGRLETTLDLDKSTYESLRPLLVERPLVRFQVVGLEGESFVITAFCYGDSLGGLGVSGENCSLSKIEWHEAPAHIGFGSKIPGFQLIALATPVDKKCDARVFLTRDGEQLGGYSDSLFVPPNGYVAFEQAIVPMAAQIDRVMSSQSKLDYLFTGYATYKVIHSILSSRNDWTWTRDTTALDWGVGCGRVARHFADAGTQVVGIDIDPQNVTWCQTHLAGRYEAIALTPPTHIESSSVDLVIGVSVFTHLTETDQFLWLAELRRVLKPGGYALVTIQSDYALLRCIQPQATRILLSMNQNGIDDSVIGSRLSDVVGKQSDYYRETFHRHDYVIKHWSRWFDVVAIDMADHFSHQDYVALRAR